MLGLMSTTSPRRTKLSMPPSAATARRTLVAGSAPRAAAAFGAEAGSGTRQSGIGAAAADDRAPVVEHERSAADRGGGDGGGGEAERGLAAGDARSVRIGHCCSLAQAAAMPTSAFSGTGGQRRELEVVAPPDRHQGRGVHERVGDPRSRHRRARPLGEHLLLGATGGGEAVDLGGDVEGRAGGAGEGVGGDQAALEAAGEVRLGRAVDVLVERLAIVRGGLRACGGPGCPRRGERGAVGRSQRTQDVGRVLPHARGPSASATPPRSRAAGAAVHGGRADVPSVTGPPHTN